MKIYSDHEANKEDWNWTNKCSLWRSLDQFFLHTHPQHHHCWPPFPTLTNGVSQGIFSENMWLPKTEPTWSYFLKHSKISLLNSNVGMWLTIGYWCYELTFWTPWFRRWGLVEPLSLSTNIPAFNSNTVFSSSIFDIAQLVGSNGFPQ